MNSTDDRWAAGDAYEGFMGRWSRSLARSFVTWLGANPNAHWLDIGCGTGALTSAICSLAEPASVVACDPSESFIEDARRRIVGPSVSFLVANASNPPRREGGFDAIVSGLVLNFVAEPDKAVAAMRQRLCPHGLVAAYVWDYGDGMQFLRHFWDEAVALDPGAAALDEGQRFPLCRPDALASVFRAAGLADVETRTIEIATRFDDFDDYWKPFLGGTGPAPAHVASLESSRRALLSERLRQRLCPDGNEPIDLTARAWAVRGTESP